MPTRWAYSLRGISLFSARMAPFLESQSATATVSRSRGSPCPQLMRLSLTPTIAAAARLPGIPPLLAGEAAGGAGVAAGGAAARASGSTVAAGRPRFFGGTTRGLKKVSIEWEVGSLVGALAWCERLGAADSRDMPAAPEEQAEVTPAASLALCPWPRENGRSLRSWPRKVPGNRGIRQNFKLRSAPAQKLRSAAQISGERTSQVPGIFFPATPTAC
jgi:hypothetical protein